MTEPRRLHRRRPRLEELDDVAQYEAARARRRERGSTLRSKGTFEEAVTVWPREEIRRYFPDGGTSS